MHNAPAVSFPVGRSRFHGWIVGLTALVTGVSGLTWWVQVDEVGWRQGFFALGYLVTGAFAVTIWLRTSQGLLCWDGQSWRWTGKTATRGGVLTVHLDLQFVLLLSLRPEADAPLWLWPEQRADKARWSDLRRAVFSLSRAVQVHDTNTASALKQGVF